MRCGLLLVCLALVGCARQPALEALQMQQQLDATRQGRTIVYYCGDRGPLSQVLVYSGIAGETRLSGPLPLKIVTTERTDGVSYINLDEPGRPIELLLHVISRWAGMRVFTNTTNPELVPDWLFHPSNPAYQPTSTWQQAVEILALNMGYRIERRPTEWELIKIPGHWGIAQRTKYSGDPAHWEPLLP